MKVVLTGAGGFIGSHVARALVARGDEVLALLRPTTSRARVKDLLGRIRVSEVALDDGAGVGRVLAEFRPQTVIHLAWTALPGEYLDSSTSLDSLTVTSAFVERVASSGCLKLVGAGTCLEYRRTETLRRETDPADPESLYGSCKHAASLVARALAARNGMEFVWARIFHVHGFGEHPSRLLPSVARSLAAGRPVDLSPGLQVRDQLHVSDVAGALVHLAQPGLSGIFNVCSGVPVTLRELVLTLGGILGRPELLRFGARPYVPGEVMFLAGDPSRLRSTGWRPLCTEIRAGLKEVASEHGAPPDA